MIGADASTAEMMASIEKARQAWEERRDARSQPCRTNSERASGVQEIMRRLPRFLRDVSQRTLEGRIPDARLVEAAKWWHWQRGNMVLMGPSGSGKSTAAAFIVHRMIAGGVHRGGFEWADALRIRWFAATALELARKQHPLGQGEAPEIKQACSARLLVLDDAGWERDTSAVAYVIDQRMESGAQTIITTGRNRDELSVHYGAAVVRRIVEAGGRQARVVNCFQKRATEVEPDRKTASTGDR